MRDPKKTRPVRDARNHDVHRRHDVRRIRCGGGYRIVRKTILGS